MKINQLLQSWFSLLELFSKYSSNSSVVDDVIFKLGHSAVSSFKLSTMQLQNCKLHAI